jgi:hypothetical protein
MKRDAVKKNWGEVVGHVLSRDFSLPNLVRVDRAEGPAHATAFSAAYLFTKK